MAAPAEPAGAATDAHTARRDEAQAREHTLLLPEDVPRGRHPR